MQTRHEDATVKSVLDTLNIAFTSIFAVECILKVIALKPKNYFGDSWNVFDFIIVIGSFIDITMASIKVCEACIYPFSALSHLCLS